MFLINNIEWHELWDQASNPLAIYRVPIVSVWEKIDLGLCSMMDSPTASFIIVRQAMR